MIINGFPKKFAEDMNKEHEEDEKGSFVAGVILFFLIYLFIACPKSIEGFKALDSMGIYVRVVFCFFFPLAGGFLVRWMFRDEDWYEE